MTYLTLVALMMFVLSPVLVPLVITAVHTIGDLRTEGDPFGGPVAMRLGVGGSWSTVGRTRLG